MKKLTAVLATFAVLVSAFCTMIVPTNGENASAPVAAAETEDINLLVNCEPTNSGYATVVENADGSYLVATNTGVNQKNEGYGLSMAPHLANTNLDVTEGGRAYIHVSIDAQVPFRLTMYDRGNNKWIFFGREFFTTMTPEGFSFMDPLYPMKEELLVDGKEFFPAGTYRCVVDLGGLYKAGEATDPSVWDASDATLTAFYLETLLAGSVTVKQFYLSDRAEFDTSVTMPTTGTTQAQTKPTSPVNTVNLLEDYGSNWYGKSSVTTTVSGSVVVETQVPMDERGDAPGLWMQPKLKAYNVHPDSGLAYLYMDIEASVPFRINMWDENNGQVIGFGDEFFNVMTPEGFSFADPSRPTKEELMEDGDEYFPAGTYRCTVPLGGVYHWKQMYEDASLWNPYNAWLTSFYIETMAAGKVKVNAFFLTYDQDYTAPVIVPGDINADGTVNIADAFLLYKGASTGSLNVADTPQADYNGDGKINITDAFGVYAKVSGK